MPPRWALILGGYAGTYFAVGILYPLATGESLPQAIYRQATGIDVRQRKG